MSWKQFIFTSNQLKFSVELKVIVIVGRKCRPCRPLPGMVFGLSTGIEEPYQSDLRPALYSIEPVWQGPEVISKFYQFYQISSIHLLHTSQKLVLDQNSEPAGSYESFKRDPVPRPDWYEFLKKIVNTRTRLLFSKVDTSLTMSPNFCPCHQPRPKTVTNSFGNRNSKCSQWEGSACTHDGSFFFLSEGVLEGVFLGCFSLVPNVFSTCSHQVPLRFPKVFPKGVPNSTSILSHMVLPKVQLSMYIK